MASKTEEQLFETFVQASGRTAKDLNETGGDALSSHLAGARAGGGVTEPVVNAPEANKAQSEDRLGDQVNQNAVPSEADRPTPSQSLDKRDSMAPISNSGIGPTPSHNLIQTPGPEMPSSVTHLLGSAFEGVSKPTAEQNASSGENTVAAAVTSPAVNITSLPQSEPDSNSAEIGSIADLISSTFDAASPVESGQPSSLDGTIGASDATGSALDPAGDTYSSTGEGAGAANTIGSVFDAASESGGVQESGSSSSSTGGSGASESGGGGIGSTLESIASTVLEGGLGLVPLVTGLLGLFGGGSSAAPTLEKYAKPAPISFEAADTGSGLSDSDYDQMGMPRLYDDVPGQAQAAPSGVPAPDTSSNGAAPTTSATSGQQITVNVQAMDARSFMDYSSQIAQAVRGAMLNSSSINDVINEI